MEHLQNNNNIVFTDREADIIACLINGNTAKSIADLLSISPNTANVHIRNIMQKIDGASKNDLVKYIEQSSQYKIFRDRYDNLIRLKKFYELLRKLSKLAIEKKSCCIRFNEECSAYVELINCLKTAGINTYIYDEEPKSKDCIYIICSENLSNISDVKNTIIFTKNAGKNLSQNIIEYEHNLPDAILKCIGKIYAENNEIQSLIAAFSPFNSEKENKGNLTQIISEQKFIKRRKYFLIINAIVAISFISLIATKFFHEKISVKSNVPVIFKDVFLERADIEEKIDQAFGNGKIKVAVLVGYGGTGKTTIARHYLKSQIKTIFFGLYKRIKDFYSQIY